MSPADIQMKAPDGWKIVGFYDSKGTNYQLKRKITFDHFDVVLVLAEDLVALAQGPVVLKA